MELLEKTDLTISEISSLVGYSDQVAYSKIFKKINGVSPKQYRESINSSITVDI